MPFDNHYRRDISEWFCKSLNADMILAEAAKPRRKYIGASWIGYECERRVALKATKQSQPIVDPRVLRLLDHGHYIEPMVLNWLKNTYDIITHDDEGNQFSFEHLNGEYKGHCDAIFLGDKGRDEGLKFPCVSDIKGLGNAAFKEVQERGVHNARPEYWNQLNIYAHSIKPVYNGVKLDLSQNEMLFIAYKKEGSRDLTKPWWDVTPDDLYVEMLYPNRDKAIEMFRRAERLLSDRNPENYPKISEDRTFFKCKMCEYYEECHGKITIDAL